jgi:thymidylate synthase
VDGYDAAVATRPASDEPQVLHSRTIGESWLAVAQRIVTGGVPSLYDGHSYATRLFDYEHSGRDQVGWVIDRLRADRSSRSATITTLQPHTDTSYVPCVSMLDFWLPDGRLELVVYAHSIDFGAKGYGNLVELASLQHRVADALGEPVGRLLMIVKSAHVYETDLPYIKGVLAGT